MRTLDESLDNSAAAAVNPFPGLRPFEDEEAHLFFGRETQVDELLRRLRLERFIAVVGTSGSGKSSLIRAGLFSALRVGAMSGAGSRWRIATMRPGNDPIGELAVALERATLLGSDGDAELRTDLAYAILERGALGLVEIVRQMPIAPDENVLVVVDQFEELFRYAQSAEDAAAAFVSLLLQATAHADLRLYVVLTMRSDFLGDCAAFKELPERINRGLYLVPRMTRDQLEAAIVGPVKVARANIEPRLVNRLLNDVGDDPDQLPVLAHALMLTYGFWAGEGAPQQPIDERHYRATGGLARAIDAHAERIYASLTPRQQTVADKLFAAITELGSDNRGIRRPLALGELRDVCAAVDADVRAVVEAYRARTCSFVRPSHELPLGDHSVIDISHEALMRGWARLVRSLAEEVEAQHTYVRLSDAAELFATEKGALLVDPALTLNLTWRDAFAPTAAWAKRYGGNFSLAMGFLDRSAAERTRQREARRRASRRRWVVAGSVMTVLVFLTVASIVSFFGAQRARAQALIAQSNYLARDANAAIEAGNATKGMLLAREALPLDLGRPDRPFVLAAALALENGLNNTHELHVLTTGVPALWVTYSPNGKRIAVIMGDRSARVYDAASDTLLATLRGHTNTLTCVAYSPDGARIVTSSWDTTARIWDAATGKVSRVLRGHKDSVNNAVFSPDGRYVLTASSDRTSRIWRADTGALVRTLRGHSGALSDAEFSPDGSRFVTASSDKTARIWDTARGAMIRILRGHSSDVNTAVFSRDGSRIVTASYDHTAILWDAKRGAMLQTLRGSTFALTNATLSPDGNAVVTGSFDGTVRVWNVATGILITIFGGHATPAIANYAPDGTKIITASTDGTIRTWPASLPYQRLVYAGHRDTTLKAAFSPDGQRIASGSGSRDSSARVWNARTGVTLLDLRGQRGGINTLDFSPDGRRLVTPAGDGTIRIWDALTGRVLVRMRSQGLVWFAAFSPDGKRIASGGVDKILHVWDASTGKELAALHGHADTLFRGNFSPDGTKFVTTSSDTRIWDLARKKATVLRTDSQTFVATFVDGGSAVMTGSYLDGSVRFWNAASGAPLRILHPVPVFLRDAKSSPDGKTLAVIRADERVVRLFDRATGAPLAVLRGHLDGLKSVNFSPDGRRVVTTSIDKTVRVWDLPPRRDCGQILEDARRAALPKLTESQRAEEFLGERSSAPLFNTYGSAGACR